MERWCDGGTGQVRRKLSAAHSKPWREGWGEQWMATAHGRPVAWLLWDAWLGGNTGQSCTYELANPREPISHDYRVPKASAGVVTLHLCPAPETHIPGPWDCPPSIFMDGREESPRVIYRSGARERERKTPLESGFSPGAGSCRDDFLRLRFEEPFKNLLSADVQAWS